MGARKPKVWPKEHYDALRKASGWYLQAWRHYRNLTAQELADEAGTSKGVISDHEQGKGARFNRDTLETYARALGTTPGFLIDHNPFLMDEAFTAITEGAGRLGDEDRKTVADLVKRLGGAA